MSKSEPLASVSVSGFLREKWLNPRRKRFWAVVLILFYTFFGFFAVPALVKQTVVNTARENLGREASLERVQFNPFLLSLRATGFRLLDADDVTLIGFDEFVVDFQLSSLFRRAWTFREIRLDGAYLHFERFAQNDTRLSRVLADLDGASGVNEPNPQERDGLPRVLIHELVLNSGRVDFRDRLPESPVDLEIGPINVSIQELSTLPDRYGQQSVVIRLPGDATLRWQGDLSLAPLNSTGELVIENSPLHQTIAYLEAVLPLESVSAVLGMSTKYRVNSLDDGNFTVALNELELTLSEVAVSGLDPVSEFFTLDFLEMSGGELHYPENTLRFTRVMVADPGVSASMDETGRLNLLSLVPKNTTEPDSDATGPATEAPAWQVDVTEFVLQDGHAEFTDYSVAPLGELTIAGLQVTASNLGNEANRRIPVLLNGDLDGAGSFDFKGEVVAIPDFSLAGQVETNGIQLRLAQPYLQQALNLQIESGALSSLLDVNVEPRNAPEISGTLTVDELDVTDTLRNEKLVGWNQLLIDRFEADGAAKTLNLSIVEFKEPFGRITIYQDGTTNLSGLRKSSDSDDSVNQDSDSPGWSAVIGGIRINDASMDFSDLSLPLPFSTYVTAMDGTLSTMDTSSTEPANIRLEGQVDEYGLARIEGAISVFDPFADTDITVEFRNLLMSGLSPYSAAFAGQKIDQGKLDLDLQYVFEQGQMTGRNEVVLSDLVLGEKVDDPNAPDLPLGLAVALLTDSNGVIDIDLPVKGNVNDPEFRIGGVIWQAFSGLITKIVSAPFALLGNLIGVDSEDLAQFQFLAGRSDLTPPELEKVARLQQALLQRPELRIEVEGPYNPAIDTPKLKFFKLRERVIERLEERELAADPADEASMLDEDIRSVLESLFVERFPAQPLKGLKEVHTQPPATDPQGKAALDELAYAADLRDRLLQSEVVTAQDLELLANSRAQAIRDAFLADEGFSADRVVVSGTAETPSDDSEWVLTELGVAAD